MHADGLIAADILHTPQDVLKPRFLGLFGGVSTDKPALEEPAPGAKLSPEEAWWRDHVAQLSGWAGDRYGVTLDRREVLVLMGIGHPSINTVPIRGVEHMLGTPHGVPVIDDGIPLNYRFGLVQPGSGIELPLR